MTISCKFSKVKVLTPTINRETNESFFKELSLSQKNQIYFLEENFDAYRRVIPYIFDAKKDANQYGWLVFSVVSSCQEIELEVFDKKGEKVLSKKVTAQKKYGQQFLFAIEHSEGNIPFALQHSETQTVRINIYFSGEYFINPF